jgi:hypothetical protein
MKTEREREREGGRERERKRDVLTSSTEEINRINVNK